MIFISVLRLGVGRGFKQFDKPQHKQDEKTELCGQSGGDQGRQKSARKQRSG